jgi:tetratricopeptide (TPR) repeat protein
MLLSAWAGLSLAAPNDFYPALLKRGIAHVGSGNFDMAAKELKVAAFGLVDDVPQFEIAQVYLTIAAQKLGHEPDARHAAQRVLAAERLEQHYASLNLPADIRASFEKIVNQILTSDQVAVLHARAVVPVQPPAPQPPAPQPQSPAPITVQLPAPITPTPIAPTPKSPAPIFVPPPAPAPKSPAPIKPQPVAPIVVPPSPQPDPKPIIYHEAPKTPIELPPAAPRAEVEPPSVPSNPRITKPPNPVPAPPTPAPKPAPVPVPVPAPVPVAPAPAPAPAPPSPAPAPATPALSATEVSKRLAPADTALAKNDLLAARAIYRALIETPGLDHASAMRIAEGSYRARDFATAIRAFERAGGFRKGEEPYHYYLAVSLYETGRYSAAKRELAAALPYIEVTPDIARYRIKIEGAIE